VDLSGRMCASALSSRSASTDGLQVKLEHARPRRFPRMNLRCFAAWPSSGAYTRVEPERKRRDGAALDLPSTGRRAPPPVPLMTHSLIASLRMPGGGVRRNRRSPILSARG